MGVDLLPLKQWAIYNIQRVNRPLVMAIQNHSSLIIIPVVKKNLWHFSSYTRCLSCSVTTTNKQTISSAWPLIQESFNLCGLLKAIVRGENKVTRYWRYEMVSDKIMGHSVINGGAVYLFKIRIFRIWKLATNFELL